MPLYILIGKAFFSFLMLLLVCRFVGKKFDTILPVVFGSLAAVASLDRNVRITDGLVTLATWGVLALLLALFASNSTQAERAVNGKPTVLIENGRIQEKKLKQARMTTTDMLALLRKKDAFNLADVEFAVLETDGELSVMKKSDSQPVTPKTAAIGVQNEAPPKVVIKDDSLLLKTTVESGYSSGWLLSEMQKQGANDFSDVFLAQVDAKNNVYVDLKDDVQKKSPNDPNTKSKLLLLASLKKIQADLEHFAMETQNQQARAGYQEGAQSLRTLIDKVQPELTKQA